MKQIYLTVVAVLFCALSYAQLSEVPLSSRINDSQTIVEGKVLSQYSFWDDNQHNIYTASKIEVYKVLKGNVIYQQLEIITPGGVVGLHKETVEPSLELEVGDVGVYFLYANDLSTSSVFFQTSFQGRPAAGIQGMVKYDPVEGVAKDVFSTYNDIDTEIYDIIRQQTTERPLYVQRYDFNDEVAYYQAKGGTTITNFTPTTVTAGTQTVITINGSGFGATAGTVRFSNADDGGATFDDGLATEIVSWNDNQIQVEVYSDAGTGPIQVVGTGTATSATNLTVNYAQLNVEFDAGGGDEAYQTRHIDRDGTGGYTWQMQTDFDANTAANDAFVRALDSWRCNTGIHWTIGTVTTTDVIANDNINIVRFDNGSELPNGTLGRCTSRWSGCGGATIEWYVEELDIVFDDGTNWNFSTSAPGFTQYDFESVAVHELGHGHQLGHVIDTNDVMHYAISNGEQQRTPSTNNVNGASDVQSRSTGGAVCAQTVMTNYVCATAPVAEFSGSPTTVCLGNSVSFTDASTNTPTSWLWDFGDGNNSTAQNPSHTYATAGTFTVTLTATNGAGSDGETKSNYITVNAVPDVSNTGSTGETCTGNDGTATVTPSGGTGSFSYLWDVAAGNQTTPTATGLAAGTYGVTVTDNGTSCQASTTVTVADNCGASVPVAEFSGTPTTVCLGTSITFTDASTNTPTSWLWDFGDGNSSTSQNPSHTYAAAGNYTVTLTATNGAGSDGETKNNYITVNALPNVSSTAQTGETCTGNDGTATVSPTGGSGNYNYQWDAAAGSQTTQTATGLTAGNYGVTVTDNITTCQATTNVTVNDDCSIPTTQLNADGCGASLSTMRDRVYCALVPGAQAYGYRVTNATIGYQGLSTRTGAQFSLNMFYGIYYGETYDVEARVRVNGVWGSYGPICTVTSPSTIPTTQLVSFQCPTVLGPINRLLRATSIPGATDYEFRAVNVASGYDEVQPGRNQEAKISMFYFPNIQPNTTYDVSVRAFVNGVWQNYGSACQVTTGSSVSLMPLNNNVYELDPTNEEVYNLQNEGVLNVDEYHQRSLMNLYPNPNEGSEVYLNLPDLPSGGYAANIEVYDLFGKRIFQTFEVVNGNALSTVLRFEGKLEQGIYLVSVTVNGVAYTQKMIVR